MIASILKKARESIHRLIHGSDCVIEDKVTREMAASREVSDFDASSLSVYTGDDAGITRPLPPARPNNRSLSGLFTKEFDDFEEFEHIGLEGEWDYF